MTDYRPDFVITPGVIFYDEDIPYAGERLYAIIYWFSKLRHEKCVASNETLAQMMGKKTTADYVKKLLTILESRGYIRRIYKPVRAKAQLIREEIIPLVVYGGVETSTGGVLKPTTGGVEMSTEISNIILVKDISNSTLPVKGTTPLSRLKTFYSDLYRDEFRVEPKVFLNGKDGGVLKALLKDFTEVQVGCLMIAHFNWFGADGRDEWEHEKLEKAAFPITWISPNINKYVLFLNSIHKLDLSDPVSAHEFLGRYIRGLSTD